jgi:hypothetical protein
MAVETVEITAQYLLAELQILAVAVVVEVTTVQVD